MLQLTSKFSARAAVKYQEGEIVSTQQNLKILKWAKIWQFF